MWQKDLKKFKKTQPEQKKNALGANNNPNQTAAAPEISFSEYCQQLNIQAIKHDTVEPAKPVKSSHRLLVPTAPQNNFADFSFIDSDNTAREFFRHGQKNLPKELRSGKIFFNRTVDVHNLTRSHALDLIERLIASANSGDGIKIIHGIGLNSENNQPILMGIIRKYLLNSSRVLAYSYGSQEQGGNGVTLVKLMR